MSGDGEHKFCRVCGYEPGDPPWGIDGTLPTFEICSSCGVEYGYQDSTPQGAYRHRERWLEGGAKWHDRYVRPDGLSVTERMARIPIEYRS